MNIKHKWTIKEVQTMGKFEITITRTGSIIIEAQDKEDALNKILEMSIHNINEKGCLSPWKLSDIELINDKN